MLFTSGSRYHDISSRTCQCPKDTNCQKSKKAVWRYDFKEVLLEALLLVRQLFYLVRERKQSESYPTIYQKSRNKIKSESAGRIHPRPCSAVAPMDVVLCLAFIESTPMLDKRIQDIYNEYYEEETDYVALKHKYNQYMLEII